MHASTTYLYIFGLYLIPPISVEVVGINRSIGVREGVESEYNVVITNSSDVRLSTNESNNIWKFNVLIVVNIPNNV